MYNYDELMIIDSGYDLRGMFSYIFQVLSNLHIFDKKNNFALVDLHTTPYNDKNIGFNAWNYYFEQVSNIKKKDLNLFKKIIRKDWFDGRLNFTPIINEEDRIRYNNLINKYISPKDHIKKIKNDFLIQKLQTDNYASIHFRGTDHVKDCQLLDKTIYYENIESIINLYDKIFICSDEQNFIDETIKFFNNKKLISYPSFRTKNNMPIHYNNDNFKYKSGEDVLVESLLMAEGKFLIRTISGVTQFAIYSNLNLKYKNIDEHFYEHYRKTFNIK